jgi:RimJ/RimL family protein N-acetyltransferase
MENLLIRKATLADMEIYFKWLNDSDVRSSSFSSDEVSWNTHNEWFSNKINDPNFVFYIFQNQQKEFVGQVRFQRIVQTLESIISISLDANFRSKGYGSSLIKKACTKFFSSYPNFQIIAFIKLENYPSVKIFEKAGFELVDTLEYKNNKCFRYKLCK